MIVRGHNEDFKGDPKPATDPVKNNGFNPCWDKTFTFKIKVPEVALLELKVKLPFSDFDKVWCFLQFSISR